MRLYGLCVKGVFFFDVVFGFSAFVVVCFCPTSALLLRAGNKRGNCIILDTYRDDDKVARLD